MRIQDKMKGRKLGKQLGTAGPLRRGVKISDELPIPHHSGFASDPETIQV